MCFVFTDHCHYTDSDRLFFRRNGKGNFRHIQAWKAGDSSGGHGGVFADFFSGDLYAVPVLLGKVVQTLVRDRADRMYAAVHSDDHLYGNLGIRLVSVNMWEPWVCFIVCFAISVAVSIGVMRLKMKAEDRKLEEGLNRMKKKWEGEEK